MEKFDPSKHLDSLSRSATGGSGERERIDVSKAVASEDWDTVRDLGWMPFLTALNRYWRSPPNPALHTADLVAYVDVLRDRDPAKLESAIRDLARDGQCTKWRPGPAELVALIAERDARSAAPVVDRRVAEAERAAFLNAAVRAALALGETECECRPRPVDWTKDARGVLRHGHPLAPGCGGLDLGQVGAATEAPGQTPGAYSNAGRSRRVPAGWHNQERATAAA
jgi:hypothetical protein